MKINFYSFKFLTSLVLMMFVSIVFAQSTQPIDVCVGSPTNLGVDMSENSGTGTTGSTYAWIIEDASQLGGVFTPNGNKVSITWVTSDIGKTFTIKVIETNASCEGEEKTYQVKVNESPIEPTITVNTSPVCNIADAIFTITGTPGSTVNYTLNGTPGSEVITSTGSVEIDASTTPLPANRTYELILVDAVLGSCGISASTSATATIVVSEAPITSDIQLL